MIVRCHNAQAIGARSGQQDAFAFSDVTDTAALLTGGVLAVLADGMGGLENGADASTAAVKTFLERYVHQVTPSTIPETLSDAILAANAAVHRISTTIGDSGTSGSTLVAAVVRDSTLHWISVGDSRLYRFTQGKLTQLSEDHVYAVDLDRAAAEGTISRTAAMQHRERDALTSCLGSEDFDRIDRGRLENLREGDIFLLCSDGLYKTIDDPAITTILRAHPQNPADALLEAVQAKGVARQDNVSILTLTISKPRVRERLISVLRTPVKAGYVLAIVLLLVIFAFWGLQNDSMRKEVESRTNSNEGIVADTSNEKPKTSTPQMRNTQDTIKSNTGSTAVEAADTLSHEEMEEADNDH